MMAGCASTEKNVIKLYKSSKGQEITYASYDKTMSLWQIPYTEEWVDTEYGQAHVITAGKEDGKPLFLLPGLFADATMWYANAKALSEEYKIYAPDMMNFAGKSIPSAKTVKNSEDYALWFKALLNHYEYKETAIAGLSYGSWTAMAIAKENPELISAMILIDPCESFAKMDGGIAWKGFKAFVFFPSREKYARFFQWMGGGYSDPNMDLWFEHLLNAIEFTTAKISRVPQGLFNKEEFSRMKMPVQVLAAGKPIIYKSPEQFSKAVKESLPHGEMHIIPDAGHALNMEKPEEVNTLMLDFLKRHYL